MCDKWAVLNKEVISVVNVVGICTGGNSDSLFVNVRNSTATTVDQWRTYLQSNPFTYMYELATPIYTPLTDEEKASLPLSAYSSGYIQLSSDELRPSKFEFRAKSSNRMQLDMLETGHYYLNTLTGNVKLGNVDIDVTEMPCLIKVDNASNNRLISNEFLSIEELNPTIGYWLDMGVPTLASVPNLQALTDFIEIPSTISSIILVDNGINKRISYFDENKEFIDAHSFHNNTGWITIPGTEIKKNTKYIRIDSFKADNNIIKAIINPITLSKLPSHRIPTTFTQGMKSSVNFGYWQGIKNAKPSYIYTTDMVEWKVIDGVHLDDYNSIELHSIVGKHSGTRVTVEDEIDISTGKYTKRVGKYVIDGTVAPYKILEHDEQYNIQKVTQIG